MNIRAIAIAIVSFVSVGIAHAAGDAAAGQALSGSCVACHGADGNGVTNEDGIAANPEWPKLAGQHPSYLQRQLEAIKSKKRPNPLMDGFIANLTEKDFADLAAFYGRQVPGGGHVSKAREELGEKIFRAGNSETGVPACAACHGPTGLGNGVGGIPRIAGQFPTYTAMQLKAFRAGTRETDQAAMMRTVARFLSDEEIAAVAEYAAGLHQ